ncbi:MAG: class A beta-lactamase-related serine hydrolase [Chitinophagaceae bacterium]|nr:MAG: class A beta-lactamase-related serine hydrolase [Chitinophagaceae bacterium]
MYNQVKLSSVVLLLAICSRMQAQSKLYTVEEARLMHDSVRLSRWDAGGSLSQYSFRYMSEFFPVAVISKPAKPAVFPVSAKKNVEQLSITSKGKQIPLEDYLRKKHIASFIVVKKGTIVYEQYFSMLPGDQHTLQSVTKVFTSLLVTSLANEKKIDLAQPIEKYLPELANSDWRGITVQQILDMRSGMDIRSVDYSTGPFSDPMHKNYQLESSLGVLPKAANTPASPFDFVAAMKKDTTAGLEAAYSNINTFVLGWLVEKVTGKKYSDLLSERIWQPMGASSDAYVCVSGNGVPWSHGGLSATLRDLARFGMLFTNSGIREKKESLISFKQVREIFDAPAVVNPMAPFKWAYQWDLAGDGVIMKGGFGGQALYVHPEKDIVVAYYNYVDADWSINNMISDAALFEIIKAAGLE